jgi:predicted small integral membrane protein
MMRHLKILLIALVALWALLGALGNLTNYAGGHGAVAAVMGRDGVPIPARAPFVAIEAPLLTHAGYAVVWAGKLVTAVLCAWGVAQLWRGRNATADVFNAAKGPALVGASIAIAMLFGGFIVIGGGYFVMWSSTLGQSSSETATQYITAIGIVTLLVAMPDA